MPASAAAADVGRLAVDLHTSERLQVGGCGRAGGGRAGLGTDVREDVRGQRLARGLRARAHGGVLLARGPLHGRRVLVGPLGRRRRRARLARARSC